MIGLVNYGVGNLRSVENAVRWVGGEVRLVDTAADLDGVNGVILPGVGAFAAAMTALNESGFSDAIRDWATVKRRPLLGVCLGMQLLAKESTEGGTVAGIGVIDARVERIRPDGGARVPHVGWNLVEKRRDSVLWNGNERATCYFVHSYALVFDDPETAERCVIGTTDHGGEIVAMAADDNVMGAQFHPEKSQRDGLDMLANFVRVADAW